MASSFSVQPKHQVFLSFRGEDTRNNFTSHLLRALERKGIDTFTDDQLIRGEEIPGALLTAIEESKISIIILSKNYISSAWCLGELSKIIEWKRTNGQDVIPIFYHVDPSEIRNGIGSFEKAFTEHQQRFKERTDNVERWRAALKEVADLSGWHIRPQLEDRPESTHIEEIVKAISQKLMYKSLCDTKCLIGIDSRVEQFESLLRFDLLEVRILGIWGMGGIGKTTIAEAVYHRFSNEFEGCCFLKNVKENYGRVSLLEDLLSKVLEDRNLNLGTSLLPACIKDRLHRKKVLIVLDDVNDSMQLDLLPEKHCFRPGSRIIVTSRDKQVLRQVVDVLYKVEGLIDDEALQLFSLYAFKQCHPIKDFMELSKKVVYHAKGVPLALKVLGSALYGRSKLFWEDQLNKFEKNFNPNIDNILRISFDGLDDEVKDIFLDIACFFNRMNRDYVKNILDGCYCSAMSGISVLIDKSLVTISHDMLEMHDLLQQMGWNIVRQESKEPGKRSRLWTPKDIYHVLKHNTGTEIVEGIFLDMSKIGKVCLSSSTFARMYNLRFLKFYYSDFTRERNVCLSQQGVESLPDTLCYLHWDDYPSKSLPSNFCPENLVELIMRNSHVERLWNGVQNLVKLKRLDLSGSQHLIEIPDLSRATKLERMELNGCTRLVKVPSSIRYLNKLTSLSLIGRQNLGNFPSSLNLRSLTTLSLSGCSNVTEFPEISENLERLCLSGTAIEEVPSSIKCLYRLKYLYMKDCKRLKRLSSSICKLKSLRQLDLQGCLKLESFPKIFETMECLRWLSLSHTSIEELPSSIEHLVGLIRLELNYCEKLKNLPSSIRKLESLFYLSLVNCSNITTFEEIPGNLRQLDLSGSAIEQLPSSIECLSKIWCLYLENCTNLVSLPRNISKLGSLGIVRVSGFPKLEVIQEFLETVKEIDIRPYNGIVEIDFKSTGRHQASLSSSLSFNGLANLLKSTGNMKSLERLDVSGYPVFDELLDNLENLISLKYLHLRDCNIIEFPSHLICISSLRELDLSGNNFETIPASIKQLLELEKLDLSYCKMLQSLPELPPHLQYLNAHDCTSLEAVSSLFTIGLGKWAVFLFTNCLKLDQNAVSHILAELPLRIQHRSTEAYRKEIVQYPSLSVCLPRSEIPEWFSCQNTGSSVKTKLPLYGDDQKFVGFALCVVAAFEDYDDILHFPVECKFKLRTNYGDHHAGVCSMFRSIRSVDSDHVFLAFYSCLHYDWYNEISTYHSNEASFEFNFLHLDFLQDVCKVKKCGVHLIYAQNDPTISEDYCTNFGSVSLPYNARMIQPSCNENSTAIHQPVPCQPSQSGSGSGSSDLLYDIDAEECNSIMIHRPSSPYDPTFLSLNCGVIDQDFGEPMQEDATIIKRRRDDHHNNDAEPSGNFSSDEVEEEAQPKILKWKCNSITIPRPSSPYDPTWLSLNCGVIDQDSPYDPTRLSLNCGVIDQDSPYDPTWLSLNCGVIDQDSGEPMQEDTNIIKRCCGIKSCPDDHHNNDAEPSGNFSSDEVEEEPQPKRLKCIKFF